MTENLVPRVQTPCIPADLYDALYLAWMSLIRDATPTRESLIVLLAHWALETGFGHACWCWNLGNKKHFTGDGRDYFVLHCNEIVGGHVVWADANFVAYPDLATGAADYLTGLRGEFRAAWPAVVAGDPAQFCHLLKLARYYTADEALYTAGVVRCYHQLDAVIRHDSDGITPALLGEEAAQIDGQVHDTEPPSPPEAA